MKKFLIIAGIIAISFAVESCGGAHGNNPGQAYMPDMYYSRAYEAYGYNTTDRAVEELNKRGISYNQLPVRGTIARGDMAPYPLPANDSGYALSVNFKNPYDTAALSSSQMKEAERVYLVNCAICHGTKLDGNGPLWNGGDGPYPAAPRNLVDDYSKNLSDGQMYHVITNGKGQMGAYHSQVHPEQRWWVIKYIRMKQGPATAAQPTGNATGNSVAAVNANASSANTAMDSTKKAK